MVHVGGPYDRPQAFQQMCAMIGHWAIRGYGRWLVVDMDTEQPLGIVGLFYPESWPEPELAWSLYDGAEGRGVAYEAAIAARDYAYQTLGWTTVMSLVDPGNIRSVALAKRMGCRSGETYDHETHGTLHLWRHPAPGVVT
jgi:ribosomal-protein-alanine N-acetyltransferase